MAVVIPGKIDQGTWLISFADLITLLLCAFLMFFSLSWNKTPSHGIQIATDTQQSQKDIIPERRIAVRFYREDIGMTTFRLSENAMQKLRNIAESGAYKDAVITLALCDELGLGAGRHPIKGQLLDTGFHDSQIVERFVGSDCTVLQAEQDARKDTRVIIQFEQSDG